MLIIITDWALDDYLNLKHKGAFTDQEYWQKLRPDTLLLRQYPNHQKFSNQKFWGPTTLNGNNINSGHKMKWHNIGNGNNQIRLLVAILSTAIDDKIETRAFLCNAYVKNNDSVDKRKMARLKIKIEKIINGNYNYLGKLT